MNTHQYEVNSNIHGMDIRQSSNLHQTTSESSLYQRGTYYKDIKVFNCLLLHITGVLYNSLNWF